MSIFQVHLPTSICCVDWLIHIERFRHEQGGGAAAAHRTAAGEPISEKQLKCMTKRAYYKRRRKVSQSNMMNDDVGQISHHPIVRSQILHLRLSLQLRQARLAAQYVLDGLLARVDAAIEVRR